MSLASFENKIIFGTYLQYSNTGPLTCRRKSILIQYVTKDQIEDHGWRHIWAQNINKSSKSDDYKILYRR